MTITLNVHLIINSAKEKNGGKDAGKIDQKYLAGHYLGALTNKNKQTKINKNSSHAQR